MANQLKRNDFYPVAGPRTHQNCKEQSDVCRPGKTACERARRTAKKTAGAGHVK